MTLLLLFQPAGGVTVPLETSVAVSNATLALTAQTQVPLGSSPAQSNATLALKAPTTVPLQTSTAQSAATLALTAPTQVKLTPSYQDLILSTPNLVGYWRLGEPSGTNAADQLALHNGVYVGSPTLGVTGGIVDPDTAVTFPTATSVTVADNNDAFDFGAGAFTLECWVKRDSPVSTNRGLLARGTGSWFWRFNNVNQLELLRENQASLGVSTGTLTDTTSWHHLAVTRTSGGVTRFYIDGSDVGGFTGGTISNVASTVLTIASNSSPGTNFLIGSMDEVAIYNAALSPTDIAAHTALGTSGTAASSTGQSSATLALTAQTYIPLQASTAQSAATLALTIPGAGTIPLDPAAATSNGTLALRALTLISLGPGAAVANATLALRAQTRIPLDPSSAASNSTLALRAATRVVLASSPATSNATLVVTAPTVAFLPLSVSAGSSSTGVLALSTVPPVPLGLIDGSTFTTLVVEGASASSTVEAAMATASGVEGATGASGVEGVLTGVGVVE